MASKSQSGKGMPIHGQALTPVELPTFEQNPAHLRIEIRGRQTTLEQRAVDVAELFERVG